MQYKPHLCEFMIITTIIIMLCLILVIRRLLSSSYYVNTPGGYGKCNLHNILHNNIIQEAVLQLATIAVVQVDYAEDTHPRAVAIHYVLYFKTVVRITFHAQ